MKIGKRLNKRRKELGLTVNDVASIIGKSASTYYKYEQNAIDVPASVLSEIAYVFDTTSDALLKDEDSPDTKEPEPSKENVLGKSKKGEIHKQGKSHSVPPESNSAQRFPNNFTTENKKKSTSSNIRDNYTVKVNPLVQKSLYPREKGVKMESDAMEVNILKMPVFDSLPAGKDIADLTTNSFMEIPSSWLKSGNSYFLYRVNDDLMYPKYISGDILIIKSSNDHKYKRGEDVLACIPKASEAVLREIVEIKNNSIKLSAKNHMLPPSLCPLKSVKIKGVVYKTIRDADKSIL